MKMNINAQTQLLIKAGLDCVDKYNMNAQTQPLIKAGVDCVDKYEHERPNPTPS